jgi:hypothetical protein
VIIAVHLIIITGLYESTKKTILICLLFSREYSILLGLAFIEFRSRRINKELLKEEIKEKSRE